MRHLTGRRKISVAFKAFVTVLLLAYILLRSWEILPGAAWLLALFLVLLAASFGLDHWAYRGEQRAGAAAAGNSTKTGEK